MIKYLNFPQGDVQIYDPHHIIEEMRNPNRHSTDNHHPNEKLERLANLESWENAKKLIEIEIPCMKNPQDEENGK